MNLPIIEQLRNDQSTYISFTKALLDFDKAINSNKVCYFTKMVALNLPVWQNPNFFIDLSSVGENSDNPNIVIPKGIQYYMENIIRQNNISYDGSIVEEIVEIAFWKLLNKMGLTPTVYKSSVTFINQIVTSNFVVTENNNGWGELVCQIPNKCKLLIPTWRTIENIDDIVQGVDLDICLFDNGDKQFLFTDLKNVIDFQNCSFNEIIQQDINFNTLLLFYTDETGIEKLHGINFIYPFENKVTYWDQETFVQKTNLARTIGYQFIFNMKTCNNQATQSAIQSLDDHTHWNTFSETLSKLNSFLEIKMREIPSIIA
jgi:hypothetical protein